MNSISIRLLAGLLIVFGSSSACAQTSGGFQGSSQSSPPLTFDNTPVGSGNQYVPFPQPNGGDGNANPRGSQNTGNSVRQGNNVTQGNAVQQGTASPGNANSPRVATNLKGDRRSPLYGAKSKGPGRNGLARQGLEETISAGDEFSPGKVVANVGGFPIFRADVIADINQLIESNLPNAPAAIKEQQREQALPFAVERAIEQKLLYADAIRTMPDRSKLSEILSSIREQFVELRLPEMMKNLKVKTPAEVEEKLRDLGTSLRHVRDAWVDAQFAGYFVREKVNLNPEITHFEMLEYYNANRKEYYFPSQVRWEQIMVRFDKSGGRQAAWDRIGELGNEVVFGANLSAVAKKSSDGYEADEGGYHDWTTKGSLVHEKVDEALFSLPVNQLSDRIESKIGFHIVRVKERRAEGYIPFSEAQTKIRDAIKKEKQNGVLEAYVKKLKKEIPIENYVSNPKK